MTTLGKYEILNPLGTGGMGTVYRARDTILEREVALKTISTAEADPELKERFYREARACARLQHPHIVTVYDLGEQDQTAYIAMELLSGDDLRCLIAEKRPLPVEVKLELMAQVCEGLAHAHRHEIIHRDVKPGNIFVERQGSAKILDFGIARVTASTLTRVGTALGTPDYMAPEQIAGRTCDSRSDLFSAAIVFYEFLTGTHPFAGANVAWRIVREEPAPLPAADPSLPASLEPVMAKGLAKDLERRFQTGDEFAAALRAVKNELRRPDEFGQQAEALRADLLAGRAELGAFARCQKVVAALQAANVDYAWIDRWPTADLDGAEQRAAALARLRQAQQAQRKLLEMTRRSAVAMRRAREMLNKGDRRRASQTIAQVAADFPDHPQLAALKEELAATATRRTSRRAPTGRQRPTEPDQAPVPRVEQLVPRLLAALEEQDRSATEELASQLRPLLDDWNENGEAKTLRTRAEQALLRADFELQLSRFAERITEADLAGAEQALESLQELHVEAPPLIEAREQARRQLEQARHHEDPSERRMAGFQARLQEFYAAVGKHSPDTAREALDQLRSFAEADGRFRLAVANCERQLAELASAPPPPPAPPAPAPAGSHVVALSSPVADALRQRAAQLLEQDPQQCIVFIDTLGSKHQSDPELANLKQAAAKKLERPVAPPLPPALPPLKLPPGPFEPPTRVVAVKPPPRPLEPPPRVAAAEPPVAAAPAIQPPAPPQPVVEPPPAPAPRADDGPAPPSPATIAKFLPAEAAKPLLPPVTDAPSYLPPQPSPRPAAHFTSRQKAVLGAAAAALLLMAATVVVQLLRRSQPAKLLAAEAVTEVTAAEARVLARAEPTAPRIVTLRKGDRSNVVRLPATRSAAWVQVQFVGDNGKVFPPGYVSIAEVGRWRSEKPDAELHLLKVFGPGESATEAELREQLYKLAAFVSRFGITPQGPQAKLEMARLNLALARLAKTNGRAASDWHPHLDAATGQLAMASVSAELAGQVGQLRRELEAVKQPEKPAASAAPAPGPPAHEEGVRRAEAAWKNGRYAEALRQLNRVLRDRPGYTPALALREKVRRAQQLETQ